MQHVKELRDALLTMQKVTLAAEVVDGDAEVVDGDADVANAVVDNGKDVVHLGVVKGSANRFSFDNAKGTGRSSRGMHLAFYVTDVKSPELKEIRTTDGTICAVDAGQVRKEMYK
jgi:hypothetical protein